MRLEDNFEQQLQNLKFPSTLNNHIVSNNAKYTKNIPKKLGKNSLCLQSLSS